MMIFTEIEAIVINQPLTYVSDNPDDLEPLKSSPARQTVSMQLLKKAMGTYQVIEDGKKRVAVSNQLWKRCLIKYLLTIQSRHKWNVNQTNIEPGDYGTFETREFTLRAGEYIRPAVKVFLWNVTTILTFFKKQGIRNSDFKAINLRLLNMTNQYEQYNSID